MGKYAVMLNADTDSVGPATNGLKYAIELDEAGHQVRVFFDGSATEWIALLTEEGDHPVRKFYEQARERGLLGGACGYCANAFGVYDEVNETGIELVGEHGSHGPDVGELVADGYELLTVG